MKRELKLCDIVLVVHNINVQLLSQEWMLKNGIFSEQELLCSALIFTDSIIQISTPKCELVITGNRFLLRVKRKSDCKEGIRRIKKILAALSSLSYSAVGINFEWSASPLKNILKTTAKNFLPSSAKTPWFKEFGTESPAIVGASYYRKFQESFMTLKIYPDASEVIDYSEGKSARMVLNFNFHFRVGKEDPLKSMDDYLNTWEDKYAEADRLTKLFLE